MLHWAKSESRPARMLLTPASLLTAAVLMAYGMQCSETNSAFIPTSASWLLHPRKASHAATRKVVNGGLNVQVIARCTEGSMLLLLVLITSQTHFLLPLGSYCCCDPCAYAVVPPFQEFSRLCLCVCVCVRDWLELSMHFKTFYRAPFHAKHQHTQRPLSGLLPNGEYWAKELLPLLFLS
jgi:hypothetical protein